MEDAVLTVAISPDSQRIATGGSHGRIKIWSAATGELIQTLAGGDYGRAGSGLFP
jgi:WD40 repeat protein